MKRIIYKELKEIGNFKAIETIHTVTLSRCFTSGGLLYGYRDRYNIVTIERSNIISIEEV